MWFRQSNTMKINLFIVIAGIIILWWKAEAGISLVSLGLTNLKLRDSTHKKYQNKFYEE